MINDASVVIGGGNWGIKEADVLGYKLINDEYYARDIDFANSTAAGTYTDSTGVIRKAPYNLLTFSEDFSNAAWPNLAATITANTTTSPSGTLTADTFAGDGTSSPHYIYAVNSVISGISYTASIYAKKNTNNFIQLQGFSSTFGTNVWANFDLNSGVVGSVGSSTTASIQSVGNGWYRCVIIGVATATISNPSILYNVVSSSTAIRNEVNTLSTSIFIWGAQLVEGTEALPYFPTTTRLNVPRIDYRNADGSLSTVGRLLIEPQRTNLITFSEQFDNAGFFKQRSSITPNTTTAPDGTMSADTFEDTNLSVGSHFMRSTNMSAVSGTVYSTSFFVKAGTSKRVEISLRANNEGSIGAGETVFNLDNGTIVSGSGSIAAFSNGWYRCTSVGTSNSTTVANAFIYLYDSLGNKSYTGTGTNTVFIWGLQIEAGAYATTYIPTTTAAVTRNADSASRTGVSSWIGQTEGTLFIDINYNQPTSDANGRLLQVYAGTETTNAILPLIFGSGANVNQFQLAVSSAGASTVAIVASAATLVPFGRQKFAIAYNAGVYTVYRNGSLFASATNVAPTSLSVIELGGSSSLARNLSNPINQAAIFTTRLTNEQLQSLTTL